MDKWIKTYYFILLAIYLLLKTDFPISSPYLFESHRSPQMYDLLSAYFTNRVIRMLSNRICVFKHICMKNETNTYFLEANSVVILNPIYNMSLLSTNYMAREMTAFVCSPVTIS